MAALHRIQWIDSEIRAGRCPNARRVAERFEISHRQAQRDFEYLRDSLGAPLVYAALERGYRYEGEAFVLPGQFVTPVQRGVLENLADYYERWAERREDVALDDVAALFARLSGREAGYGRTQRAAPGGAPTALGLPFLATLALPRALPLPHMTGLGVPLSDGLAPYYRADEGPGKITFEFHDADGFLMALLGAGLPFRVEHPRWLRERVAAKAAALHSANAPAGTTGRRNGADATRSVVATGVRLGHQPPPQRSHTMTALKTAGTTDARIQPNWTTFIGATEGVLRAAGMLDERIDRSQLMGLSGRAFHLTMDQKCWAGCPTMYEWSREHVLGFERVGVLAEAFHTMPDSPVYEAAQRRAVGHIKASLDRGVAVVLWGVDAPEFGVAYGYDDADGVFLVDGVARLNGGSSMPILYENVGRTSDVPELHYVIPIERVRWDPTTAHRSAVAEYVERMERRAHSHGVGTQQSGLLAYDVWLKALEGGTFEAFGLRYNTAVLADAKQHSAVHFERLASEGGLGLPRVKEVATAARENADVYGMMMEALGMNPREGGAHLGKPVAAEQAKALIPLVKEAKRVETRQVELAKGALAG